MIADYKKGSEVHMMKKLILCSITIGLCIGVMSGCGKSMTDKLEESSKQVEQQVN